MATCTVCGSGLATGSMFCGRCGLRTGGGDGPADPAFAPPPPPLASGNQNSGGNNLTAIVLLGIALIVAVAAVVWLLLSRTVQDETTAHVETTTAQSVPTDLVDQTPKVERVSPATIDNGPAGQPELSLVDNPEIEDGRFYNVYASIDDASPESDTQAQRFIDQLAQCGIGGFMTHSSRFPTWRPGYVVVLSGPYATTSQSDGDMGLARSCGLDAYRRAR